MKSQNNFLITEYFFNLFLEVSHIQWIRIVIIQIGKKCWDLETCRKCVCWDYCRLLPISDKILATPWVSQSLKSGKLDVFKPHSYLTANQTDLCCWLRKEWVHISQGRHGKLLADKGTIVANNSSVRCFCRRCCCCRSYFSKFSQEPSLGCLASRGGPVSLVCVAALDCWHAHVTFRLPQVIGTHTWNWTRGPSVVDWD